MASPEDEYIEIKRKYDELVEKNEELAQKLQYWMITASQREDEKIALMKDNNELRLKLGKLRSSGGVLATNLDQNVQSLVQQAVRHLIDASSKVAEIAGISKVYIRNRLELEKALSNPSPVNASQTERTDKIHRVPPLMMGGQSIQPVVSLSRTLINTSNHGSTPRNINQNRSANVRAVPMHMLQDVYIPLTRIDANGSQTSSRANETNVQDQDASNGDEDLSLEGVEDEVVDESQNNIADIEEYEEPRILDTVAEESEHVVTPLSRIDNPLEGPSWLLDVQDDVRANRSRSSRVKATLEPDSTTEEIAYQSGTSSPSRTRASSMMDEVISTPVFTPTVRKLKRRCLSPMTPVSPVHVNTPKSPILMPRIPTVRRNSMNKRVLKVLVAKMRFGESEDSDATVSPTKKSTHESRVLKRSPSTSSVVAPQVNLAVLNAPSPKGATDAAVIVSETRLKLESDSRRQDPPEDRSGSLNGSGDGSVNDPWMNVNRRVKTRTRSRDSNADDSSDTANNDSLLQGGHTRTRRTRKPVTYTEKPLNRKLRRC